MIEIRCGSPTCRTAVQVTDGTATRLKERRAQVERWFANHTGWWRDPILGWLCHRCSWIERP